MIILVTFSRRIFVDIDKGPAVKNLSKSFDTINNELLIAKLHANEFSVESLEVILSYLQDRW